ncbi:Fucosyltransferase [Klebsormidium nitens]|uniref:Fucosyltransferase n=1 Tax=Klebsormidium nitens TaxID=105231 RepID=A0A1Y1HLR9_KLENI|nr:Fucosyltransferase [Klebsormidium nitens]|eukprot:GAQ79575.1 Fucosyltransferase [Klebsormidium nitens]
MAVDLAPLYNALGRDSAVSQYKYLRPIAVALGFAVALLFLYTLHTGSDQLVFNISRGGNDASELQMCKAWFEEEDQANAHLLIGRDFDEEPVNIYEVGLPEWFVAPKEDLDRCDIKCRPIPYHVPEAASITQWDASTDEWPKSPQDIDHSHGFAVIRNVEPPIDYPGLAIDAAHRAGYDIVMTSELASDVPIPYVGAYVTNYFAPGLPFEEKQKAAMAVISNCGAKSFRLKAVKKMQELGIQVDSYGWCERNKEFPEPDNQERNEAGQWDRYRQKIAVARTYLFYLAFENSHWPDYVTEKFYHVLQAGSVPIVIGAPNIFEFAPAPNSFLELRTIEDVPRLVERMKYLMENRSAYEEMLEWRRHEASDNFKAMNDVRGVHATCRLCIHIATKLQALTDNKTRALVAASTHDPGDGSLTDPNPGDGSVTAPGINTRDKISEGRLSTRVPVYPCTCRPAAIGAPSRFPFLASLAGASREVHRVYVRESGRFRYRPVLLDGRDLSVWALHAAVLQAFQKEDYEPSWVERRKEVGLYWTTWKVHRIYPSGMTLRESMGNGSFVADSQFQEYLREHPCPKLEVVLV